MRHRHLAKTDAPRQCCQLLLMRREAIAMHQHQCQRAITARKGRHQIAFGSRQRPGIQRKQHFAACADALVHLDHVAIEQLRQTDMPVKNARAVLIGNAQGITKATRHHQQGALALALEQGIGGHGSTHLHRFDGLTGNGIALTQPEEMPDAGQRRIGIAIRVLRQQLVRQQHAIRTPRHQIGEGASTIDPELPFFIVSGCFHIGITPALATDSMGLHNGDGHHCAAFTSAHCSGKAGHRLSVSFEIFHSTFASRHFRFQLQDFQWTKWIAW